MNIFFCILILLTSCFKSAMAGDIKIEAFINDCIDEKKEVQSIGFRISNSSNKAYWINSLFLTFHWEIKDKSGVVVSPYSLIQPIYETDQVDREGKDNFVLVCPNSSVELILQTKLFQGYELEKNQVYILQLGYNSALPKNNTKIDTYTKSVNIAPLNFKTCD